MVYCIICLSDFTILLPCIIFRVHAGEHSSSGRLNVVITGLLSIFLLTKNLVHQILVSVTNSLQALLTLIRLVVCDGGCGDASVAINWLDDFVRIRRYALQVVDLSFTHLDTYGDVLICL